MAARHGRSAHVPRARRSRWHETPRADRQEDCERDATRESPVARRWQRHPAGTCAPSASPMTRSSDLRRQADAILARAFRILDPVFVGFSSKDIRSYHLMCAWKAHEHIEFNFADFQLNDAIDSENESYIKTKLRRKIVRSDVYALLIGTDTWQKTTFVKWEVEVAIETRRCSCPVRSRRRRLSCRGCTPAASRFAPARRPRPGSREEQRRGGSWPWCCSHLAKDAVRRRAYPMGDVPLWVSIWMTARVHARATLARASIRASRSEATPAVLGRSLRPSVPQRTEAR